MDTSIIVAIITAVATVIATLIGGILQIRNKDRESKAKSHNQQDLAGQSKPLSDGASSETSKTPFDFWGNLSRSIVIVFAAKFNERSDKDGHPTFSLRDQKAADTILTFLTRKYPEKRIISTPALTSNWQTILSEDADLIVIGGFVVNAEFLQHRSVYQKSLRLKMGRLCRTNGRHVFHVATNSGLLRDKPYEIEKLSSKFVIKDYALVSRSKEFVYGVKRNLIAIAGVKGNGTLGAAIYLTQDLIPEFSKIASTGEKLEAVIKTDVINGAVDKTEIVEIIVDGQSVEQSVNSDWEKCELKNPCETCVFGEILPKNQYYKLGDTKALSVQGIVFDLDDTLIDTYTHLISPLEIKAAKKMKKVDNSLPDPDVLASILLDLHKRDPANIESILEEKHLVSKDVLDERSLVFNNIDITNLIISPEIKLLLREIKEKCNVFLITEGDIEYQKSKILHLNIDSLFTEVVTIPVAKDNKKTALTQLMKKYKLRNDDLVIIGNRLDKEILMGNKMNITTVWVKHGEGSDMVGNQCGTPDYVVEDLSEIKEFISNFMNFKK